MKWAKKPYISGFLGCSGSPNYDIISTARYNKVFQGGVIDGFTVVALDGTEAFRTQSVSWSCEKCRRIERTSPDGSKETDYHENVVGVAYVGRPPNLILGVERIAPGEGELTATQRFLKELHRSNYRYADVITLDSLLVFLPHKIISFWVAWLRNKYFFWQSCATGQEIFKV